MGTVTVLPCNVRTIQNVRVAVADMARRYGRSEQARRHAFATAMRALSDGSSSAWAIQQARQELKETQLRLCGTSPGGDAA